MSKVYCIVMTASKLDREGRIELRLRHPCKVPDQCEVISIFMTSYLA
jgi:hypothetical protein